MKSEIAFHELKMYIPVKTGFVSQNYGELMYVVYDAPYCCLHFTGKKKYKVEVPLHYMLKNLPQNDFFQCNRAVIINIGCCKEFNRIDGVIKMEDDMEFSLARRRAKDFNIMRYK